MVGLGGQQRLQFCRLTPLCERHGVMRVRFIKPDKVQQVGARFGNLIPYGIRKRTIPAGEGGSPEEGLDNMCGMRGHSLDRNLNDNDCQS